MRAVGDPDPHHLQKMQRNCLEGDWDISAGQERKYCKFPTGFPAWLHGGHGWDWEGDKKGKYQKLQGLIFMAEKDLQLKCYI